MSQRSTIKFTRASTDEDIESIRKLQYANLRQNIGEDEANREGYVTARYSSTFLKEMNDIEPILIARKVENEKIVGYCIVVGKELATKHQLLKDLSQMIDSQTFNGRQLSDVNWILCGQCCVAKGFRGKSIGPALYKYFYDCYSDKYDYLITEVAQQNPCSIQMHLKVGFEVVDTNVYEDQEFDIVLWDWRALSNTHKTMQRSLLPQVYPYITSFLMLSDINRCSTVCSDLRSLSRQIMELSTKRISNSHSFASLCNRYNGIRELKIFDCSNFSSLHIPFSLARLPSLSSLILHKLDLIEIDDIEEAFPFLQPARLQASSSSIISSSSTSSSSSSSSVEPSLPRIKKLDLSYSICNETPLLNLFQSVPAISSHVTHLILDSSLCIESLALSKIVSLMPLLEKLQAKKVLGLSSALVLENGHLHKIDLEMSSSLRGINVLALSGAGAESTNPCRIRNINLSRTSVTSKNLFSLLDTCKNLQQLRVLQCGRLKDAVYINSASLRYCDLQLCPMRSLSVHCPNLEHINVGQCYNLVSLQITKARRLEVLDLSMLSNLTSLDMKACPHLKIINFSGCKSLKLFTDNHNTLTSSNDNQVDESVSISTPTSIYQINNISYQTVSLPTPLSLHESTQSLIDSLKAECPQLDWKAIATKYTGGSTLFSHSDLLSNMVDNIQVLDCKIPSDCGIMKSRGKGKQESSMKIPVVTSVNRESVDPVSHRRRRHISRSASL